ncbi:cupin domain-containing protein [Moheibacter sediminis]|uniref:Cupin domain-containing protein n=1 Tax=Moheibacter sediminis TaxID=1434700 RepID=A0A1W2A7I3_9FLAO|nr:cupin domain-containing protein [Moheibacter sediminis]SMC56596.1 Cupin domain-containing protein [Moheibacter sediminis]
MRRRNFILTGLLSVPVLSFGKLLDFKLFSPPQKGFFIKANESRFNGEQKTIANELLRCVVSNKDSDGQLLMGTTLPGSIKFKGGPPLHIHKLQDEIFFVVSGEFLIQLDKQIFTAKTGDATFIPRGTPHTFANPHENNPGSLISIHIPGSDEMEAYFKTIASGNFPKESSADLSDVGPPIDIDAYYKNLKT